MSKYTSHGWPIPNAKGTDPEPRSRARCGGPEICQVCRTEAAPIGDHCSVCEKYAGQFAPAHDASPRCQSGGHNHCSCDVCF